MPIVQGGGGIWLPQSHIAVIYAGKDFAHKAGLYRLRHGECGKGIPEEVHAERHVNQRANFANGSSHCRDLRAISTQRIGTVSLVTKEHAIHATILEDIQVMA